MKNLNSMNPRIIIETQGLMRNLLKALDCMTFSAKTEIKLPLCDVEEICKHIWYNKDGKIITDSLGKGLTRMEVNKSDLNMDRLNESGLAWHYEDEKEEE